MFVPVALMELYPEARQAVLGKHIFFPIFQMYN